MEGKVEQVFKKPFVLRIPLPLFLSLKTPMEKAVYLAIYSFTNNGKQLCLAGQRAIAGRAGCAQGTVVTMKKILKRKGLIEIVGKKRTLGGWVDKLRLSGQPLTSFEAKTQRKKAISLGGESDQSRGPKRSVGEPNTIKDTIKDTYKKDFKKSSFKTERDKEPEGLEEIPKPLRHLTREELHRRVEEAKKKLRGKQ